jgi:hypothetical protein
MNLHTHHASQSQITPGMLHESRAALLEQQVRLLY